MTPNFASYWNDKTQACPDLAERDAVFIVNSNALKQIMLDAYIAGLDRKIDLTRMLNRMAAEEERDQLLGPASLKPEFDEIFGRRSAG